MISDDRLQEMADALARIDGVRAVALGGSRARGTHHAGSDVDLGVYYDADSLDLTALERCASDLHGSPVEVAGPGQWGQWSNGGAWLTVDDTAVDWILRDLDRVVEQCARALRGEFAFEPQAGHPLGFLDVGYAAEVALGVPLVDPTRIFANLQADLHPYPEALREAMVENLWQADFLVANARKGIRKGDVAYVALCCSTAVLLCAHAWHAADGSWVTHARGAVPDLERCSPAAVEFGRQAQETLSAMGVEPADLAESVDSVEHLVTLTKQWV